MVDVKRSLDDTGKITYAVATPKSNTTFVIYKTEDGFNRYKITTTQGRMPEYLTGFYTTPDKALQELLKHIDRMPVSRTVRRDQTYQENKDWVEKNIKNGAKLQPNSKREV